jgi:uncharacterized protein YaeQ
VALKATVHRAEIEVADIDRGVYLSQSLTLARHPSETAERLMLRLLAWAMHADAALEFGRGLSTEDEPDLWLREPDGRIRLWIELGLPEERRLRRAAGRAADLVLLAYGGRGAVDPWWERNRDALGRLPSLRVLAVPQEQSRALEAMLDRSMRLQFTLQEGQACVTDATRAVTVEPVVLRAH